MYDCAVKIYTKGGDSGETSLYSGGRVAKSDLRIEAYGTVDELNSVLGLLSAEEVPEAVSRRLADIQSALFSIGSRLADAEARLETDPDAWSSGELESWIDEMESELPELRVFVLPGGCREAALAHVARTLCRRAERRVVAIDRAPDGVVPYLNRLSDALFVLARWLNRDAGFPDVEWRSVDRRRATD